MSLITSAKHSSIIRPGLHRISVDEYERIIRAAALDEPDRVELIDGYLVDKMGKSAEHGYATKKAIKAIEPMLAADWTWRAEQPVRIPMYDEPEPDTAIVRGTDDDYEHRLPGPEDVGLLIEVSLGTLDRDRNEKLPVYALARIPVYWIINLIDRQIEVYSEPDQGFYRSRVDFRPGEAVPITIGAQQLGEVLVDTILPSPAGTDNGA
jgi:Uma2 family endonuclease